jgi:DNA repair protein RecO (recombination protein O)
MSKERYASIHGYSGQSRQGRSPKSPQATLISAQELQLMKRLGDPTLVTRQADLPIAADAAEQTRLLWQRIERLLRQYAEYHFDRTIRSATLIDACFPVAVSSN